MEHPTMTQAVLEGSWDICGSSMICSPDSIARKVFSSEDIDLDYSGEMTMYLFRRFGYPRYGWDSHKDVISYFLTTPDPDVMLWCKPSSGLWLSFGFGLRKAFARIAYRAEMTWRMRSPRVGEWEETDTYKRIETALHAAISELMRPVYVRDVDYNLLGRVTDEYPEWQKSAEHSPQAGYGLGGYDPVAAAHAEETV